MSIDPRNGPVPKASFIRDPAVKPGMKRQTTGDLHPYLHGQTLDDSVPEKSFTCAVPVHDGTPSPSFPDRATHTPGLAKKVLEEGARLGRQPEKT